MGDRALRDLVEEWDGFAADAAHGLDVDLFGASLQDARATVQGLSLEATVSLLSGANSRAPRRKAGSGGKGAGGETLRVLRLPTVSKHPKHLL